MRLIQRLLIVIIDQQIITLYTETTTNILTLCDIGCDKTKFCAKNINLCFYKKISYSELTRKMYFI